jgi:hypothetical protein
VKHPEFRIFYHGYSLTHSAYSVYAFFTVYSEL